MERPLEGLRVADFSRQMAGPSATQIMADYGADVIKIESLPRGDSSRITGVDFIDGESALFLMWNRGKRSIALDLRRPEGLKIAHRLIRDADILVQNYRSGVADEIGIGAEKMLQSNPRLIYCSLTGFGPDGPLATAPATDPIIQAMSGVMSVTGEPDGEPVLIGVPIADFTAGLLLVQGAMFALVARGRTGRGQQVDISMLAGLMSALTTRLASYWTTGEVPRPNGNAHTVVAPYQVFATSDGHAMFGVWGGDGWERFCAAIERPDLADDQRYKTNHDRVANRSELTQILRPLIAKRTTEEWQVRFHKAEALFGPVLNFSQLFEHPQVKHSGLLQEVEHLTLGPTPQLAPPVLMSETPGRIAGPPPVLGQHTAEILAEIGFTSADITALEAQGIVASHKGTSSSRRSGNGSFSKSPAAITVTK